ncbi:MAG: hypothetical protein JO309_09365 [Pseudonocardiales bacterium]|nr:hypothetical protein [Pseudonocardiales bacterium]MBV9729593.1 hypothetical protein [Pseudonocardiales bacterium]
MSDAMSFAELAEQYVELLPARTVLSMWRAGTGGHDGAPGTRGADGESVPGSTWWFIFGYDRSGVSLGDASSKHS